MDPFAHRRDNLTRCLAKEDLDAYLISNPVNVSYLTGFSGDSSYLILTRQRCLLVSDARFTEQIDEECRGLETFIRPPEQRPLPAAAEMLGKLGVKRIGFESAGLTVADFEALRGLAPTLEWKGNADRVETLRLVKDQTELAQIREAIDFAEKAYLAFRNLLSPNDTERELCDAMEGYLRKVGSKGSPFPPIIAAGARAALPHAPPTDRRVGDAEVLLVDWGAAGAFYKSDLTRVLDTHTKGTFTDNKQRNVDRLPEIHSIVATAQTAAINAVRPGVLAKDVDAAARRVIADAGYGPNFGHGLGHGIGLQVHEGPAIRPHSDTPLVPGMVFTIEPGIYLPGWGGVRLEDDVLVTSDGCEVLTHLSRDPTPVFRGG